MSDLAAQISLLENATYSVSVIASPAFCASKVSAEETRLNATKGTFSTDRDRNALREPIRCKGYQSRISRTKGRLTAIGLLNSARTKKQSAKRMEHKVPTLCPLPLASVAYPVYAIMLSR